MTPVKKMLSRLAVAAALGVGGLAMTAGTASAYIACNAHECWHVDQRYHYRPALGVTIHPDDWYFHRDWSRDRTMQWRDRHDGRGYYRNGIWIQF